MINDAIVELARNRYLFHIDLMHHQIIHLLHALLIVNAMLWIAGLNSPKLLGSHDETTLSFLHH